MEPTIKTETIDGKVIEKLEVTKQVKQTFSKEQIEARRKMAQTTIAIQQRLVDECDTQLAMFK